MKSEIQLGSKAQFVLDVDINNYVCLTYIKLLSSPIYYLCEVGIFQLLAHKIKFVNKNIKIILKI